MHWDSSISFGTVLSLMAILVTMGLGFHKFLAGQKEEYASQREHSATMTAALNNLSLLTDTLGKQVQVQNGRLVAVETKLAIQEGVRQGLAQQMAYHP